MEPGETVEQTALREAAEEVGLEPSDVAVAGRLTPVDIAVSGFRLNPVVATSEVRPSFLPAHREVARILLVPVAALLDPSSVRWATAQRPGGRPLTVPAFHFAGEVIWGATAMLLAEFLTVLGWPGPSLGDPDSRI